MARTTADDRTLPAIMFGLALITLVAVVTFGPEPAPQPSLQGAPQGQQAQ